MSFQISGSNNYKIKIHDGFPIFSDSGLNCGVFHVALQTNKCSGRIA